MLAYSVPEMRSTSLLSNHARVLLCIARDQRARIRDIAHVTGLTERASHKIVDDLCSAGYISRYRSGLRNYYEINHDAGLGEPLAEAATVGALLRALESERFEGAA